MRYYYGAFGPNGTKSSNGARSRNGFKDSLEKQEIYREAAGKSREGKERKQYGSLVIEEDTVYEIDETCMGCRSRA